MLGEVLSSMIDLPPTLVGQCAGIGSVHCALCLLRAKLMSFAEEQTAFKAVEKRVKAVFALLERILFVRVTSKLAPPSRSGFRWDLTALSNANWAHISQKRRH